MLVQAQEPQAQPALVSQLAQLEQQQALVLVVQEALALPQVQQLAAVLELVAALVLMVAPSKVLAEPQVQPSVLELAEPAAQQPVHQPLYRRRGGLVAWAPQD